MHVRIFCEAHEKKHVRRHSRQIEKRVYVLSFCFNIFFIGKLNFLDRSLFQALVHFTNLFELFERKLNFNKSDKF